jgi:hypothetical protein
MPQAPILPPVQQAKVNEPEKSEDSGINKY